MPSEMAFTGAGAVSGWEWGLLRGQTSPGGKLVQTAGWNGRWTGTGGKQGEATFSEPCFAALGWPPSSRGYSSQWQN